MTKRLLLVFAFVLPLLVPVHAQQLVAPDAKKTVAAVITDHREINTCDEVQRAFIVDWAAQRLNKAQATTVWGRKSRGKVENGKAINPNTDGLTFLRPDGKFEIYDSISGSGSCGATWDGFGPFNQGENGYWAPPQLGPEGSVTPPVVDPKIAELEASVTRLSNLAHDLEQALQRQNDRVSELEAERNVSNAQIEQLTVDLDQARRERDAAINKPVSCEAKVPGWVRALGIRVGCQIVK
jgi:hypothetical protein